MDKFDRELQRQLLLALYNATPDGLDYQIYSEMEAKFDGQLNLIANLIYLQGHGLLTCRINQYLDDDFEVDSGQLKITSKGIDFIRNDGGLGAILNVINVRLHSDTVDKLESIIKNSSAPVEDKASMISTLRKLPEDAIKHLNLKLLDVGLSRMPDVFHAIQNAMHNL